MTTKIFFFSFWTNEHIPHSRVQDSEWHQATIHQCTFITWRILCFILILSALVCKLAFIFRSVMNSLEYSPPGKLQVSHLRVKEPEMIQNDAPLYPLLRKTPRSLSFNRLHFPGKARLKHFPGSAWVCLCQNPAFLETSCLHSNTVHFGRPAPYMTNEDSKPTSSADFQSKAYTKEVVNPPQCGSLPGSVYEYCFVFLLLLTWGLKFSWDLPHFIKEQLINCLPIVCNKGCTALNHCMFNPHFFYMACRIEVGEAFCSHATVNYSNPSLQCVTWSFLSCIRNLLNLV